MASEHPIFESRVPQVVLSSRCTVCFRADIPEHCLSLREVAESEGGQSYQICQLCDLFSHCWGTATDGGHSVATLRYVECELRKIESLLKLELEAHAQLVVEASPSPSTLLATALLHHGGESESGGSACESAGVADT